MVTHAVGTALLAATIGLAITVICAVSAWALAPHGDGGADTSVRLAVMAWLFAHHVPIDLPDGVLTLTPLGLVLLPLGLCYASGRQLARALRPADLGAVGRAVGLFALIYGVAAAVVAGLSAGDGLRPHPFGAFVAGCLIALLAGGLGMLRAAGRWSDLIDVVPPLLRQSLAGALAGALAALAAWVGIAAFLLALLLTIAFPEALEITRAYDADLLGGVLLAVLGIALLPNLVLWLLSFTAGVGFSLGVDSPVTPQAVEYGPLPVLPPLAAVPPEGPLSLWALLVLVVPLLAGAVTGVVVHRRAQGRRPERVAGVAALAGLLAGGLLGLLAGLSAGSAGSQRLAGVGPVGWQVGVVAAVELAVVAVVVSWECGRLGWDGQIRWPGEKPDWLRRGTD